jgi:hypothetical protein
MIITIITIVALITMMIRMPVNCRALVAQIILIITVMISNNNKTGTDERKAHAFSPFPNYCFEDLLIKVIH